MEGMIRIIVIYITDIIRFFAKITLAFALGTTFIHVAQEKIGTQLSIPLTKKSHKASPFPLSSEHSLVIYPAGFGFASDDKASLLKKFLQKIQKERQRVQALARQRLEAETQGRQRTGPSTTSTPALQPEPKTASFSAVSNRRYHPGRKRPLDEGIASFYGKKWNGRKTANGEIFDAEKLTAAHKTLPFGTFVRVVRKDNGKSVVVRINDRGPFIKGRIIDLSTAGARRLGMIEEGLTEVVVYPATLVEFLQQFEQ